jgi:very-short-patch-repair endonuclease
MRPQGRTVERQIARIAHDQHGLVTRRQLLAAGITAAEIKRRLAKGSLLQEHRGVYRVGHRAPSVEARYLAAVLACGEGAMLTGPAAGHLLGLLKGAPPDPEVVARRERRVRGVGTHRSRRPGFAIAMVVRGIPVTSVPQTLIALAGALTEDALARACHEAGVRYGTTPADVEAVLAGAPNAPGAGVLRRILHGDTRTTLSALERRFLSLLTANRLPLPATNRLVGKRRVDCHWREARLIAELDGYRYHRSRHAWELDRLREREARALGHDFRRYSYRDVFEHPGPMLEELRNILDPAVRLRGRIETTRQDGEGEGAGPGCGLAGS